MRSWKKGKAICFVLQVCSLSQLPNLASAADVPVTWEEQSERLQNVNAAIFDAVPFGEPPRQKSSVAFKIVSSLLPKVNPTIGGKRENVPASPVHSIPELELNLALSESAGWTPHVQLTAGYLPKGSEKLLGLKVSVTEWLAGAALGATGTSGDYDLTLPFGLQYAAGSAQGAITGAGHKDTFKSSTLLAYAAPSVRYRPLSLWGNVLLAQKKTRSSFEVPSDDTTLVLDDTLGDSAIPWILQAGAGWQHTSGFELGVAQLWVPKRVAMPRLLVSFNHPIAAD